MNNVTLSCLIGLTVTEIVANLKARSQPFLFETKSNLFNLTMRDDRLKAQDDSIITRGNSSHDPSFLLLLSFISSTAHMHCLYHWF
ncbi:hypothetical protein N7527_003848 [Penicillium freii]|uniref:Uncharacterized protein n=1 Tax=Penicillium freii TaxID=48697 RepID=A0A101M8K0_PENFR|nr:hypothetical protein N7527_003848 [Penicillium freii]KUM55887.1 hypothetical protein ACN42_g11350 [Penicillium freii]